MSDRRTFLRGLAALPIAATPALAAQNHGESEQAASLRKAFSEARRAFHRADQRLNQAEDATAYPEIPEQLFTRKGDPWVIGSLHSDRHPAYGRMWYGEPETIETLRGLDCHERSGVEGMRMARRRDEILATHEVWRRERQDAEDASGLTAAWKDYKDASSRLHDLRRHLIALKTTDTDVIVVKAMAFFDLMYNDEAEIDDVIDHGLKNHGVEEEMMAMSLARDFVDLMNFGPKLAAARGAVGVALT